MATTTATTTMTMWTLAIQCEHSSSFTSTAIVAPATAHAVGARWGSYVLLRCSRSLHPAAFRLEISTDIAVGVVQIDHWPVAALAATTTTTVPFATDIAAPGAIAPQSGDSVHAQCVAAPLVRAVQYMELVPAAAGQPPLALAFTKRLLRKRVFVGRHGAVALRYDGIDYGQWRFQAYFQGSAGDTSTVSPVDAIGVVDEQTLVLLFPFTASRSALNSNERYSGGVTSLQPIGAHGESFRELVTMALQPANERRSSPSRHEAVAHSRSMLLHGASGSGKTTLVQQVAAHLGANLITVDCSLLATPRVQLTDLFTAALRVQPAVLLLEDLELLFPRALDETKYRLVGRLVSCLDAINRLETASVAVVGTVTAISALHTRVRQLFAEEVVLEMPEKTWTVALLQSLLPAHVSMHLELLQSIAVRYGQRPSNIASIARQIALQYGYQDEQQLAPLSSPRMLQASEIDAFAREIAAAGSSSGLTTSVPDVAWSDIGGLDDVKQQLLEMVVWPLERPHVFLRMGISPPLGMLLHGPPGTGKTMLAKAAARASGCHLLSLAASDLLRAEFGESEKAITRAFDTARALSPCMIFIDEFQSLFGDRSTAGVTTSRMISQLLVEMDSLRAVADDRSAHGAEAESAVATRVFVLAATNALGAIDPAFLQPGRFENIVYVGLPSANERRAILQLQRSKMPWHDSVDVDALVDATVGANAASLVAVCQAAAIQAMQRIPVDVDAANQCIEMNDFVAALATGSFEFRASASDDNRAE